MAELVHKNTEGAYPPYTKIKLIAFDVNGTLFDDTNIFWNAINGIFPCFNKQPLPIDVLQERFGQPWTRIYREEGISEDAATDEELYRTYNELYQSQSSPRPFRGVKSVLRWLRKQGIELAIVSTQQNEITIPLLENHGLDKLFFKISGSVSDKAKALKEVLRVARVSPHEAAYVGDQEDDTRNAKKAGYASIAFVGGLHTRERLEAVNPDFVITSFRELRRLPIF